MAENLLKRLHGHHIFVDSVGVRASPIDPFAVAVMDEMGIDIGRHRPKTFDDLEDNSFDLVISLTPEAQHKSVELTRNMACEVEFWPSYDPTAVDGTRTEILNAYRIVRDSLWQRILARFPPEKIGTV